MMQAVSLSGLSVDNAKQQKLSAWLQGHNIREDGTKDTFYGAWVDVKRAPMRHHTLPFSDSKMVRNKPPFYAFDVVTGRAFVAFDVAGEGLRIPTEYMVKFNDKWRRVYCRIFSNSGIMYIGQLRDTGEQLIVRIDNE